MPDRCIAVFFSTSKFDKVWKMKKDGSYVQAYSDIPKAKNDCITLRECLAKYQIKDEDDIYNLEDDPTEKEIREVFMKIDGKLKSGKESRPVVNYLIIYLFAGHGILRDSMQSVLLNEYM